MMRVWVVLAGIMFFAQCAMRAEPYWRVISGREAAERAAPRSSR